MFTSNYTSKEDLIFAKELGAIINLDDISIIDDLASLNRRGNMPELLCFRLNPGIGKTDSETKSNILGGPDAKFGIPPFQIIEAYQKAKDLGVKRFGIHMMTGSNVLTIEYWNELIDILFEIIINIKKNTDISPEFINIGGGIGIPYKWDIPKLDIEEFTETIYKKITEKIKLYQIPEPRLYMECGRFITGPYGWLISKCNVIKNTYQKYYGLDACMSNLMRPGMYNAYHEISILDKDFIDTENANVVGTLCENNDWFAKNRMLPIGIKKNDIIVIHDTGAHGHSMGFQYNGKLRAPEIEYNSDTKLYKLIRDRDTIPEILIKYI
jgi:diaminopimelate decarboxylase